MFSVIAKNGYETYRVYATKSIYKTTFFLVYHDDKWDWCNANLFEPWSGD
jgi:hypothetical protein